MPGILAWAGRNAREQQLSLNLGHAAQGIDDHGDSRGIHEGHIPEIQHADFRHIGLDLRGNDLDVGFGAVVVYFPSQGDGQLVPFLETSEMHGKLLLCICCFQYSGTAAYFLSELLPGIKKQGCPEMSVQTFPTQPRILQVYDSGIFRIP